MDYKTVLASVAASAAATVVTAPLAMNFVMLQAATPGVKETGNSNISGSSIAGRFGANVTPTLARIQAAEAGTLMGVRSNTLASDAFNGLAAAPTGGTVTARFVNSSASGKAVLGENISTTGSAFGGDFKARSTTGGSALLGRQIATSGPGIGVNGTSASPNGIAGLFNNTSSNNGVQVGTGGDSLLSKGALPRHEYVVNTPAAMVPVAYGFVLSSGTIHSGSGNFVVTKVGTGQYDIDVQGITVNNPNLLAITATAFEGVGDQYCSQAFATTGDVRINVFDQSGNALTDSDFSFIVYRSQGFAAGPQYPDYLENPPQLRQYGDTEAWANADPKSLELWVERRHAWERAHKADRLKNP